MRRNSLPSLLFLLAAFGAMETVAAEKQDLEKVEAQIVRERAKQESLAADSRKLTLETVQLRREMIDAARNAQEKESLLTSLENQLSSLVSEADEREKALAVERQRLAGTLGALARLSRNAPQAMIFYPGTPADMVRSALLLRVTVPQLGSKAVSLSREIDGLTLVKRDIAGKMLKLRRTGDELELERVRLRQLLDRKSGLRRKTNRAFRERKRRLERLATKAETLRDLIARIHTPSAARLTQPTAQPAARAVPEKLHAAIPPIPETAPLRSGEMPAGLRPFPEGGPLTLPVAGRLIGRYGEPMDFGNTSRGIRLETRPDAQVVTPFDGRVVFAGPFRNYGQILIIEHQGGYHTLLAGLSRIDAVIEQWVLAGEPLGAMDPRKSATPTLYVELRRNGQPINPLPWIAAGKQKVRG